MTETEKQDLWKRLMAEKAELLERQAVANACDNRTESMELSRRQDQVNYAHEKRNADHVHVPSVTLFRSRPPQFEGLKNEPPKVTRLHRKCMLCFAQIPAHWPTGDYRFHCDACIDKE